MRIAVLRGGPSGRYEQSLKSGEFVLSCLREQGRKYDPVDVFISREGDWHVDGVRRQPEQALKGATHVWNALHGEYGEDGELTRFLQGLGLPHTGSNHIGLSMAYDKKLAKKVYGANGMNTPRHETLGRETTVDKLVEIFRTYLHPVMVKPVKNRAAYLARMAQSFQELETYVAEALRKTETAIVEEFVRGEEVSCGVLENFRGEKLYSFVPTPNTGRPIVHKLVEEMAKIAHRSLGLRHYSLSEFIITPKGKVYIIDTNALPELHEESPLFDSLINVGVSRKDFIEHVLSLTK